MSLPVCNERLFNSDPHGFTFGFGLEDFLLEFVEPLAGFEDFADALVAAYEDAALRVFDGVARMDADALPLAVEVGATEQDGKPLFELR